MTTELTSKAGACVRSERSVASIGHVHILGVGPSVMTTLPQVLAAGAAGDVCGATFSEFSGACIVTPLCVCLCCAGATGERVISTSKKERHSKVQAHMHSRGKWI